MSDTIIHEAFYDALLVDRIPQSGSAPLLVPVDRFPALGNVSWSKQLNDEGSASISTRPERISDEVKQRLLDPENRPMELWVYREGDLVFAGPVIGMQYQGRFHTLTLHSRGLLYYLRFIMPRLTYDFSTTGEDPFVIIKTILDFWQSQTYGNFGIDTSAIGTSSITRKVKYRRTDLFPLNEIVKDLSQADVDGFDYRVDPLTRQLTLHENGLGADKSTQVTVDARNLRSYSLFFDLTAGDFATEVFGAGQAQSEVFFASAQNSTRIINFGRLGLGVTVPDVEDQAELQDYVNSLRDVHSNIAVSFGGGGGGDEGEGTRMIPMTGMTPKDVDPGDTISVLVDLGFGEFEMARQVAGVFANVDLDGKENMNLTIV